MRAVLATALAVAPALAGADGLMTPVRNPCAGRAGGDICGLAARIAADMTGHLPQDLAPCLPITRATHEGARLVLALSPPPDGPAATAPALTAAACARPPLAALVAAGGSIRFTGGADVLADLTLCPETP